MFFTLLIGGPLRPVGLRRTSSERCIQRLDSRPCGPCRVPVAFRQGKRRVATVWPPCSAARPPSRRCTRTLASRRRPIISWSGKSCPASEGRMAWRRARIRRRAPTCCASWCATYPRRPKPRAIGRCCWLASLAPLAAPSWSRSIAAMSASTDGVRVTIHASKTDQEQAGAIVGLPYGDQVLSLRLARGAARS